MKTVSNWLITWTASLLKHPRAFILVPILCVFLVSYPTFYDYTISPFSGKLLDFFDDCTLENGYHVSYEEHYLNELGLNFLSNFTIFKVTFGTGNVLKYDNLNALSKWILQVQGASFVLSPLSFLSVSLFQKVSTLEDQQKVEKCFLKMLNHDLPKQLLSLFFEDMSKQNHFINLARQVSVIVFAQDGQDTLLEAYNTSLSILSQAHLKVENRVLGDLSYRSIVCGDQSTTNWINYVIILMQAVFVVLYLLRVYLIICNNHKIRSNFGLVFGWFNGVLVSVSASFALFSRTSTWSTLSDTAHISSFGFHFLSIMILSSRTLFRAINDLAGDSTFGESESLHKRLIKFYLGFNSSIENSRGVFHVSSFIRRVLRLDSYCNMVPIPNITIILLINTIGLSSMMFMFAFLSRFILEPSMWYPFIQIFLKSYQQTITALIIDHLLQLTYMVTIIVIDLHRIDLSEFLTKVTAERDSETMNLHEVNPFSAKLLAAGPDSQPYWKQRLGTHLLKTCPFSPQELWLRVLPLNCLTICATLAFQAFAEKKNQQLLMSQAEFFGQSTIISDSYDTLYYIELVTVFTLILAISEMVFTLTYSERQKHGLTSSHVSDETVLYLSDLTNVEDTKKFESISLCEDQKAEILRLFVNPKAPFVVISDFDHRVLLWSPLSKLPGCKVEDISTVFETTTGRGGSREFWPVNHVQISNEGDYIMLINNRNCRIKCFNRNTQKYAWELSLTGELSQPKENLKPVLSFFRKKTVVGFFARELLLRSNKLAGGSRRSSNSSLKTLHGNYPPPLSSGNWTEAASGRDRPVREYDELFNREEFVMILETGDMITISCDSVKVKVYNMLHDVFPESATSQDLKVVSLKFMTTSRVNDRVICTISNGQIIVGSAVNNIWRFSLLKINKFFTSTVQTAFASPSMARGTWSFSAPKRQSVKSNSRKMDLRSVSIPHQPVASTATKFPPMNDSTIVTLDFVGMFVRVKDLQAELIDIQTGTVLRLFHIGSFKPGTFRVSHSEPTHCKFCGCVSFETMSLLYEDLYEKTLIVHTYRLENKKSRSNICLRVERDPLEIRCLGFDSVVELQYWFDDIEMWELTDINVVVGIKRPKQVNDEYVSTNWKNGVASSTSTDEVGLSSLRNRRKSIKRERPKEEKTSLSEKWQGFVATVLDGKLLEYKLPLDDKNAEENICMRPTMIVKFGFKAVAIAFGQVVKIVYLGNDKLIENDLYYSGSASTINPLLRPGAEGTKTLNDLLFINKRRRVHERRFRRDSPLH